MENLRIIGVNIVDNTNIEVSFSHHISKSISTSNISIVSELGNVENPDVLRISIMKNILNIECQPLTAMSSYYLLLKSTDLVNFISVNGEAKLVEDNVSNKFLFLGPLEKDNPVKNYLRSYLQGNIYDIDDETKNVTKFINLLSVNFSKALYDIGQVKNENYISFDVENEEKVRGSSGFDRLNEESAYEILRVGFSPSSSNATFSFSKDSFDNAPISLQFEKKSDVLTISSDETEHTFNINNLILNLDVKPISKLVGIKFIMNNSSAYYNYDIGKYGYQIKESRYDKNNGFSYALIKENQIKLNSEVLSDPNFIIDDIINVQVDFEFKNLGKIINEQSLEVFNNTQVSREVLPPLMNIFSLKHAPILDSNNRIPKLNGISVTNINSHNPNSTHPAFVNEIEFRLNSLPFMPGQYAVDYENGTVYVYGQDNKNTGTGDSPPVLSYKYKLTYKHDLDYTYDKTTQELVALPNGSLINYSGTISFNYEEVLIPDQDYKVNLHKEELAERLENRLVALNCLKTKNSPITNVFKIYNETSGEIYSIDRFENDKIFFRYNNPPNISNKKFERVNFKLITNELLFVESSLLNINSLKIFKIKLENAKIVAATEDGLGYSQNTSINFSNFDIFNTEKYFNIDVNENTNIDSLLTLGEYTIDYNNGIIYVCVSNTQNFELGTVTYKTNTVVTLDDHILSVDDIYTQLSALDKKNLRLNYSNFNDNEINLESLINSDEKYFNEYPYQIYNSAVGVFDGYTFQRAINNDIKLVRNIFEYQDLINNISPINFAISSEFSQTSININPIEKSLFDTVKYDGYVYYVNLDIDSTYISSNLNYDIQVNRVNDNADMWTSGGYLEPGNPIKLILSGNNSPQVGDNLKINYSISINDLSRLIIDYNRGDLFVDYTYLNDEIVISYEYGDNEIDFRKSKRISTNDTYYVSYKVGALRGALLSNFGNLVNIPQLSEFDTDFERERYRDALTAALSSFLQGPTIGAMKNIGKTISHIEPHVSESVFNGWSLGNSLLNPESIKTTGQFSLLPGRFENGVLINEPDQTIQLPGTSNLRLEEGTFSTWIIPQWNGLDNTATLNFNITKDGYFINPDEVFIGSIEDHPTIINNTFSIDKSSVVHGKPEMNKDGIFIYYDKDIVGDFKRWYIEISDGYVNSNASKYKIKINSSGKMYDTKSLLEPSNSLKLFTGTNSLTLETNAGTYSNHKVTFLSSSNNYILDYGSGTKNRISLYKDVSGYLTLQIYDKNGKNFQLSADISNWKSNDLHHIAFSWKLNSTIKQDEIHLFVDGFETANNIKYGQSVKPYLHQKFRTISEEDILTPITKDIVSSDDLQINSGSMTVSSSINFSALNISPGDSIIIDELGFNTYGYTITGITGQQLVLDSAMPVTLNNGKFFVNKTDFSVKTNIDIASKISVSKIASEYAGTTLSTFINSDVVNDATVNFNNLNIESGYNLVVTGLDEVYTILQVNGNSLTLNKLMESNSSNNSYNIYSRDKEIELSGVKSIRPSYQINKDTNNNNILTLTNNVSKNDLVFIKTYGLNYNSVKANYYVWGDGYENILKTQLPAPISLDDVKIKKVILKSFSVTQNNSTFNSGQWEVMGYTVDQPVTSANGRTLQISVSGTNIDFNYNPTLITINGLQNATPITENLSFAEYGSKATTNKFTKINSIDITTTPLDYNKSGAIVKITEKESLTTIEDGYVGGVIRYAYPMGGGYNLTQTTGDQVTDASNLFSSAHVGNYLFISSPPNVYGYYSIESLSDNRKTFTVNPVNAAASIPLPNFSGGVYQTINVNQNRAGMQNGFFILEKNDEPGKPYFLTKGNYEIEYNTYSRIELEKENKNIYFGSDSSGNNQADAILDYVKIDSIMLNDTRVGETLSNNSRSITKEYNTNTRPITKDRNTLVMINFNSIPFENESDTYVTKGINNFQSSVSLINDNFNSNVIIKNNPIVVSNDGILDTKKESTIEFWINPSFDTSNDPNNRYYFDAFSAVTEELTSQDLSSIYLNGFASKILNVKVKNGDPNVDYFAGGKLEFDSTDAIKEEVISNGNSSLTLSSPARQVISVKITNDLSEVDYFIGGVLDTNGVSVYLTKTLPQNNIPLTVVYKTIENKQKINRQIVRLNKKLPYQNSKVVVSYIPNGTQGDRVSIFKDKAGYVNFNITASGIDYIIRSQVNWKSGTWHRVKASYKVNGGKNSDEMRLFLDGYQYSNVLYGSGIIYGQNPIVYGMSMPGDGYNLIGNIKFKDSINTLNIGSEYNLTNPMYGVIDNFRISNIFRPIYAPYGEALDINYNPNLNVVLPVVKDLYTTYLLDFDRIVEKNNDFAVIKNKNNGSFDFEINIFDNFDIISKNQKSRDILDILIKQLKPAGSRAYIKYTT